MSEADPAALEAGRPRIARESALGPRAVGPVQQDGTAPNVRSLHAPRGPHTGDARIANPAVWVGP
jgi:hypothetical protein